MGGRAFGRRRVSRWMLLVLLCVGVVGMHTLGHSGSHQPGSHQRQHEVAEPTHGVGTPSPVAGDTRPAGERLPDLDPGAVCLAVLTSFVLLLVAVVRACPHRREETGAPGLATPRITRPSPQIMALRLTRVSVLRI
ncbi:DUF6153 family protein [Nonomuraea sp. NPDC048916]|uniref:DUF6153 family protein n=1 Tax=Nonomuraea sp. NPDC048916 TaxID=3154232 RepID=UPI0033D2FE8A